MLKDLLTTQLQNIGKDELVIHIIKKYEMTDAPEDSFKTKNFSILLMKTGFLKIQLQHIIEDLSAYDLLIIPKEISCRTLESQDILQFFLISFSSESAFKNVLRRELVDSFYFFVRSEPLKINLEEKEFSVLSLIYKLLFYISKGTLKDDFDYELKRIIINLFLYELRLIYAKQISETSLHISQKENIVIRFLSILSIHCKKHHNVKFYAGALLVSPNHLNKTVKEVTGKSAKKIILEAILAEALNLLEDSPYTIAEIAEELEFTSVSEFSRFFKKFILLTPSEYRSKAIERFKSR